MSSDGGDDRTSVALVQRSCQDRRGFTTERSGSPMRRHAGITMVAAAVLVPLLSAVAIAQDKPAATPDKPADTKTSAVEAKLSDDTMEALREKIRADKKLVVASALQLTDSEAQAFWPVYGSYQSDMITHYDRVGKLLAEFAAAQPAMSDKVATQLLNDFLNLRSDHVAILKRYVPRFEKVLPPKKVALFYQVENKIRAVLDYQLAREIPLLR
jgi:hypothetical protein